MTLHDIRNTGPDGVAASIRILLGLVFIGAGAAKYLVPMLAESWSGQLTAAQVPFYTLSLRLVPLVEITVGVALLVGAYVRIAALMVMGIMVVAIYVHVVVDDPGLFPLQPGLPIIPIGVMVLSSYLLWRGAGARSLDLQATMHPGT